MATPNPDAFEAVALRGRTALAWEILRRDPAYRAAFSDMSHRPVAGVAADADFAARWGLHFR